MTDRRETVEDALLENHLTFLATHRGRVVRDGGAIFVESDRPEFTYAILTKGANLTAVPDGTTMVQVFPSSGVGPNELTDAGFELAGSLSYMVLGDRVQARHVREDLAITRVGTQAEMDAFSEVQSRGFFESGEAVRLWRPWLGAANDRNRGRPDQTFYIASLAGAPVGTALTVFTGSSAGIYAVATLPGHRRTGVSGTLLQRAVHDASAAGADLVLLQVKQDSYVEALYEHLGFRRAFATGMYRRG